MKASNATEDLKQIYCRKLSSPVKMPPSDQELDHAIAQLAEFQNNDEGHHKTQKEILDKYKTLMQDYKRLRSDLEEERDLRERYKQLAKGQERNPFVLVLVDGDGYVFDDDLVGSGPEGGANTAQSLDTVVKSSLRAKGLDNCRIMVRIYANLSGLSKALSKVKLAGPEKRSLIPFVANFNRSNELFDFVDAGELKENADFKIRAMFRQFVENPQCKHIYFAACHDVGYISELTPYSGNRDRITLVRTHSFHREFSKLNLRVEDFPNIFRNTPLDGPSFYASTKSAPPTGPASSAAGPAFGSQQVCTFFLKGQCKNGKNCHYLHPKPAANGHAAGSLDWRAKSDNDFISGHGSQVQDDFASVLPSASRIPFGQVPINAAGWRLDAYIPPSSFEDRNTFNTRTSRHKLCNSYHINGACLKGDHCGYDHEYASPGILNCLIHVIRNNPCPKKGACRSPICLYGHVCQKPDCRVRGLGNANCKLGSIFHTQDLQFSDFVAGAPAGGMGLKQAFEEQDAVPYRSRSGTGMTSPPSSTGLSDNESSAGGDGNGALVDFGNGDDSGGENIEA